MRDYDEALTELLSQSAVIATPEQQSLNQATGRILAERLTVQYDSPMFDNSAMDGYALNDIHAGSWQIVGQVAAGDNASAITLQPGQAVRIFTGAGIPGNTDAVVIQENTSVSDKTLTLTQAVKAGANIRRQGEELTKGQTLVEKQTLLSPAVVGLIASQGIATVQCYQPLTVTLFSTGDELTAPDTPLAANRIYDANRPMLLTLLRQHAYLNVIDGGILPDDYDAIKDSMQRAAATSDIILSSGGASVGDKDYVKEVLTEIGQLQHWKLAIKPGKPFAWGHINACKVFLLPGNPVSSFVTCLIMALPAIKQLAGNTEQHSRPVVWKAQADFAITTTQNRREFLRATIESNASGLWAKRLSGQGSHMLSGCAFADILVEVPAETTVEKGQWLNIYPLQLQF
jgi:molybdopterin molybdotransferase